MSFDLYIQVFEQGRESGFSLQHLREVLRDGLVELEEDFWQLQFSESQSSDLFLQPSTLDSRLIHTVCVHRPCADMRLWQALYALLHTPGALFHFPGCAAPMTRDENIAAAAPEELMAALGQALRIDGPEQLRRAVESL